MSKSGTSCKVLAWALLAAVVASPLSAGAAEKVGDAVRIATWVGGSDGALSTGDPIHRNERLKSNGSGSGAFVFEDGTKLAIGPNSAIVVDEFVYKGGSTFQKLTLGASKGTFRWISGKSDHSAYKISTPSGALGVRGTAFDVYVAPDGTTAVTLLTGAAEFCNRKGCQTIDRRCNVLIARTDGTITRPKGVVNDLGIGKAGRDAFPFLSGKAGLPRGFRSASSCAGLGSVPKGSSGPAGNPLQPSYSPPDRGGDRSPNDGGDGPL